MIAYGGLKTRLLPDPAPVAEDIEYRKLKRKLDNHVLPEEEQTPFCFNSNNSLNEIQNFGFAYFLRNCSFLNKIVTRLRVVQFCPQSFLVNTNFSSLSALVQVCFSLIMITDRTGLHSIIRLLLIVIKINYTNGFTCGIPFIKVFHRNVH